MCIYWCFIFPDLKIIAKVWRMGHCKKKKDGMYSIQTSWILSIVLNQMMSFSFKKRKKVRFLEIWTLSFILKLKQSWHSELNDLLRQYQIIRMLNNLKSSNSSCQYYTIIFHSGKENFHSIWKEVQWTSNHLNWPWKLYNKCILR